MTISTALSSVAKRVGGKLNRYSPQILTTVGVGGLIAAGVLAAKSTLKLEETLNNSNARLENVKHHLEEGDATQSDVNKAVVQNALDLAKLYWLSVTVGVGGVTLIFVGHNIMHKRNLALIGAYATLQEAFNAYRARVIEEHGAEADEQYRYGLRQVEVVDPETGKKTKALEVADPISDYIFKFDMYNDNWDGKFSHNDFFVTRFERYFNDKLQADGHVFLQDVTRALGFDDSKVGAVTGWLYKRGTGDDYISFGIKDLQESHGYILLNFNVDGVIIDHL